MVGREKRFKVVSISVYPEDMAQMEALQEEILDRTKKKVSRSEVLRLAIHRFVVSDWLSSEPSDKSLLKDEHEAL